MIIKMPNMPKLAALGLLSALALGLALGAPSQPPQASSPAAPTTTTSASSGGATSAAPSSTSTSSASSSTTSSPPSSSARPPQTSQTADNQAAAEASAETDAGDAGNQVDLGSLAADIFDGKNPFADDSLWQIPLHLVRDLTAAADGQQSVATSGGQVPTLNLNEALAELAEEGSSSSGEAAGEPGQEAFVAIPTRSSSTTHTVVSHGANQDLKAAAGYHYPTSHGHAAAGYAGGDHHHHDGHHDNDHYEHQGSNHGDHYGGGHHGDYFQYVSVPKPYAWEFGYRRGNPKHTIERYEHGKGPHFKTKVKWSDKKGYGVSVWDYNHDDHHHHYDKHYGKEHYGKEHHGAGGHYGHH